MKHKFSLLLVILLNAALLLPGGAFSAEPAAEPDIEAILSEMTLEEKVGQMMAVSFRIWKEIPDEEAATIQNSEQEIPAVNITELNDEVRECLQKYHFGSVILFAENCRDAEQTLRLVADIQAANQAGGGIPLLFAMDQEGGTITRMGFATPGPGNMALAATGDPQNAAVMAGIYGKELGLLGIHADYAPVVDVNNNPANPVIGIRSFSDNPDVVSAFATAYIQGLHNAGTIATVKHFPGHGNTGTDSHTGLPSIDLDYEALKECELVPFRAAIDAGADMFMTAHIQYPKIEKETYVSASTGETIYLPATMSHTILTDILRGDMGFDGVIVTDALNMAAIADHFTDEDTVRLIISAGADMLILPPVKDTSLFRQVQRMTDLAIEMVRDGRISEERINESVRRILALKQKYGLLDQTDFTVTDEQVSAAVSGTGSEAHRAAAWEIGEKALTLVKNENQAFPAVLQPGEKALILFADSCASRAGTGELVKQILESRGAIPENAEITVMKNTAENGNECLETAAQADHVILVHRVYNLACLDPSTGDGFSSAVFDSIIEARHAANKPVIVVSTDLPYDAARFPGADAILLAYGSSAMREVPAASAGAGSGYMPNLPAALCACFGQETTEGKLPVNIPALDDGYRFTDQVLYSREKP